MLSSNSIEYMIAKEHEKLLAMELELEKVSKNHPDQSSFSSNLVGSLSVNLVLREIESGEDDGFTTYKLSTFHDCYHDYYNHHYRHHHHTHHHYLYYNHHHILLVIIINIIYLSFTS